MLVSQVYYCLLVVLAIASMLGCVSANVLLSAADAGLKAYESGVQSGSDQYVLADKLDDEINSLNILYTDAQAASSSAKPGVASQIAAISAAIAKDGQSFLSLVAIKNPQKQQIAAGVIAAVEAFIVAVQNDFPDPSGNSVQLNSTAAQLKAAAASAKTTAKRAAPIKTKRLVMPICEPPGCKVSDPMNMEIEPTKGTVDGKY